MLMYINRVKSCFDRPTRILVVQSLVLNLLNYCNTIWGTTNTTLINAVQKLQNFAIKVADGRAKKFDHVTPLFNELKWLSIRKIISFNTATTTYKQLSNFYPQQIINLTTVTGTTGSRTRQQDHLFVPRTNTLSGGRSLSIRAPILWNKPYRRQRGRLNTHFFHTPKISPSDSRHHIVGR